MIAFCGNNSFNFFGIKIKSPEYHDGYSVGYKHGKQYAIKILKRAIKELEKSDNGVTATTSSVRRKRSKK